LSSSEELSDADDCSDFLSAVLFLILLLLDWPAAFSALYFSTMQRKTTFLFMKMKDRSFFLLQAAVTFTCNS